jgi:DNA polymerase IV (archaeal DinB-like DNA polymerase)
LAAKPRVVLHVDLDAFYVSAEVREDPGLKGKPVVVGADPKEGRARGVVVACSYEARRFGLKSGMPISSAYRLCPDAVYLRPNWRLYDKTSEDVMATLKSLAVSFEQASIDEAFLDITGRVDGEHEAEAYALRVKQAVKQNHGLTCSVGVAPNKSAAKIASDMHKPDGLALVPFDSVEAFLSPLPVSVVPGIGRKTQEFLKERGIEKVGDLQKLGGTELVSWFGKNGVWLWGVVHGQEMVEVRQQEIPKSLSVERTFQEDLSDYSRIGGAAAQAASELIRRLKQSGLVYRVAGIKIRFRGFETHTREKTLVSYTDSEDALKAAVRVLLKEFQVGKPVRLIGVRVADLKRLSSGAPTLDGWADG